MIRIAGWVVALLVLAAAVGTPVAKAAKRPAKTESATKTPPTPKKQTAVNRRGAGQKSPDAEQFKDFIAKVERFLRRAKGAAAETGLERSDLKRLDFWLEELRAAVAARHWDEAEALKSRISTFLQRHAKAASEASAHKTAKDQVAKQQVEVPKPITEAAAPEAPGGATSDTP